jgi:CrcB protein
MKTTLLNVILVGAGGFAGSVCRYLLMLAGGRAAPDFPIGTLAANGIGCLLIGILAELAVATRLLPPHLSLLLATGFCGGLTTMSSFMLETCRQEGRGLWPAAAYVMLTFALCLAALLAGLHLTRLALRYLGVI